MADNKLCLLKILWNVLVRAQIKRLRKSQHIRFDSHRFVVASWLYQSGSILRASMMGSSGLHEQLVGSRSDGSEVTGRKEKGKFSCPRMIKESLQRRIQCVSHRLSFDDQTCRTFLQGMMGCIRSQRYEQLAASTTRIGKKPQRKTTVGSV